MVKLSKLVTMTSVVVVSLIGPSAAFGEPWPDEVLTPPDDSTYTVGDCVPVELRTSVHGVEASVVVKTGGTLATGKETISEDFDQVAYDHLSPSDIALGTYRACIDTTLISPGTYYWQATGFKLDTTTPGHRFREFASGVRRLRIVAPPDPSMSKAQALRLVTTAIRQRQARTPRYSARRCFPSSATRVLCAVSWRTGRVHWVGRFTVRSFVRDDEVWWSYRAAVTRFNPDGSSRRMRWG